MVSLHESLSIAKCQRSLFFHVDGTHSFSQLDCEDIARECEQERALVVHTK